MYSFTEGIWLGEFRNLCMQCMEQNYDIFYHHMRISFASVPVDWSIRMLRSISYSKFSKFIGKHVPSCLGCVFNLNG